MANILDDKKKNEPVVGAVSPAPIASASTAPVAAPAQYTPTPIQRASVSMPADRAFRSPADQSMNQARDWAAQQSVGVNQQLQMQRNEMGTNNTSLTQMAAQIDPSIKRDAERARQWRLMTPQQRRAEVDRLALEQDMRTADSVASQDGIAKYGRDLADPTGTFIDSYGRSNAIYSPETQIRIREHQRKIESQAADMFSSYDRTKWATEKDMYQAVASLPAVQEAGEFGKAIAFNIVRKYASPEMKAKMEAEDRNLDVFKRTFKSITDQEIDQMQQEMGGEYTNMGNEEFAKQIYMNKDDNFRANSLVERVLERAGVRYTVENGRVVPDQGWAAQAEMREEERKAKDAADAKAEERKALEAYEDKRFAAIQQMNPERAAMMIKNPITVSHDDLSQYAPEKQETNWDEIYQNDARVAATEAMMSWARFTNEAEAAAEAARQFPVPALPPDDPKYQQALAAQQQAVEVWRTQVNPPEKRSELEREIYNLKLRGQELRKGFQNPPAPEPTSGGYGLTMDSLGIGNQARQDQYSSVSVRPQSQPTANITLGSGKKQNRQNYEKAGTFRVGTLPDESIYEQYKATGRVSVSSGEIDKIPVAVSVAGKNEYITMVDPGEFSSFMKKRGVGAAHPVKVRVIPISDVAEISASDKEVESMRTRFGISPFASKKQVLAVAADRINSENKKRVHPFKNLLDWSPDLEWFQA